MEVVVVDQDSIDVKMGVFGHAQFWVEYYGSGTIGTYPPNPQLHAVIHFHESMQRPPIPMGILVQEQPGGLLRSKKTTYQLTVGKKAILGVVHNQHLQALSDISVRAFNMAFSLAYNAPDVQAYAHETEKYLATAHMFTVYLYARAINSSFR